MLINTEINTNRWSQICISDTRDMVVVQFTGDFGQLTIHNIYNDCNNSEAIARLGAHLASLLQQLQSTGTTYALWCRDFNRHYPMWDEEQNHHIFTVAALREADKLLMLLADYGMEMALPKGIPTLEAMATKNWTRPDNVFCSDNLGDKVITCMTDPRLCGPGTDHVLILTTLELPVEQVDSTPSYNFQAVEWDKFHEELARRLLEMPEPGTLDTTSDYETAVSSLTRILQETIGAAVLKSQPSPHSKRWWNKELDTLKKKKKKLSSLSYT